MNNNDISVILPIYNLNSHRFNNFCFLIKKLNELGCLVLVIEQESENTQNVEQQIIHLENVKHIVHKLSLKKINKSILINEGAKRCSTEFVWMVDCDFYTDFKKVLSSADDKYDFIRPFNSVLFLNKEETYNLQTSDSVKLGKNSGRPTNQKNGKFSFICRLTDFNRVNGMREDFEGWGFQDLDFVENRLGNSVTYTNVDILGYHMFHKPASRENVNINRQLYVNYKKSQVDDIISKKLKDYQGQASSRKSSVYLKKDHSESVDLIKPSTKVTVKKLKLWEKPDHGLVYSARKDVYFPGVDVITVKNKENSSLKNVNGKWSKVKNKKHFMYFYYEYICHIYDILEENQTILFANDEYVETFIQAKELMKTFSKINEGKFIREPDTSYTSLHREIHQTEDKRPYSKTGGFLVKSDLILNLPFEYYYDTFENLKNWSEEKTIRHVGEFKYILVD